MPEVREYTVRQVREVRVRATKTTDAVLLASAAFEHGQDSNGAVRAADGPAEVWGNTTSRIRETELSIVQDR